MPTSYLLTSCVTVGAWTEILAGDNSVSVPQPRSDLDDEELVSCMAEWESRVYVPGGDFKCHSPHSCPGVFLYKYKYTKFPFTIFYPN
jgi:hypothetical protein